jgi:UDP-N-acetylglucosamine 1-carboxyvinyltransferase
MSLALKIVGGVPLNGEVAIAGSKNAALPELCATLLTEEPCRLTNLPHLSDIATCINLLCCHGASCTLISAKETEGKYRDVIELRADRIHNLVSPYEIVSKMRASFLVLGPLLARFGEAKVSMPGGCAIGLRPIDLHLAGLRALGAEIEAEAGYILAKAPHGLRGADVRFEKVSVGATEHLMMAAALAKGTTRLFNAAREPEIVDLADVLRKMGATVEGAGTETVTIEGRPALGGFSHAVIPDRIETGTFLVAAAVTGGRLTLRGVRPGHSESLIALLKEIGVEIRIVDAETLEVSGNPGRLRPADICTAPHPGVATDMQAQLMALLAFADGVSRITEEVFENRFMHVPEMLRMGADVSIEQGNRAVIRGKRRLTGAELQATDLRASVSLVLMALAAEGTSYIHKLQHIDRGYERIEEKLRKCGARIERVKKAG